MEDIVLIKSVIEVHVVYLDPEYHIDFGVSGVSGETADAKLDDTNRGNRKKNDVE